MGQLRPILHLDRRGPDRRACIYESSHYKETTSHSLTLREEKFERFMQINLGVEVNTKTNCSIKVGVTPEWYGASDDLEAENVWRCSWVNREGGGNAI